MSLVAFASQLAGAEEGGEAPDLLRVATLNLAHGRGLAPGQLGIPKCTFEANLDAVAVLLNRKRPEVIALQEADAASAWSGSFDHVAYLVTATQYPHVHHGVHLDAGLGAIKARYGTALLSALPLSACTKHPFAANQWHVKGFVTAEIDFAGRRLRLVSLHLDSGSKRLRQKQADEILAALRDPSLPLVVMGDFNSTWADAEDAVRKVADGLNLRPYAPEDRELLTFPSSGPGRRIDWILVSDELEFVEYAVWPDRVSDHLAVAAALRWTATPGR
ncbi:MAG: endonuclease/exonuclease/phosphatase family protein [Planctomycetes bacterium]|nr:endonuclease/exonuclease/phosphatase family protein [Planctomycetota bacterium]